MGMRVWTVMTQKGGAGKTTSTINLAVVAAERGEKTLIIDCDFNQASAMQWWRNRTADEHKPYLVHIPHTEVEKAIELANNDGYTHVFIDTPGFEGLQANQAASQATFCVVPCKPAIIDMQATVPTAQMLKEINKEFAFLFTQCPSVGREIEEAAQAFSSIGMVCSQPCHDFKGVKRAYGRGEGITEYAQIDKSAMPAATEIRNVYSWFAAKEDRLKKGNDIEMNSSVTEVDLA